MHRFLPLFPLKLVAFPGERLNLHIFEPRYRQLIGECRDEGITFGIPPYLNGGVAKFGTEMRLVEIVQTYDSGELDIITEGVAAFALESFVREAPGKLYAGGEITSIENDARVENSTIETLRELYTSLHQKLNTTAARDDWSIQNLSFSIADETVLTFAQRLHLLSISSEEQRLQFVIEHLRRLLPLLDAAEETRRHVAGNGKFYKGPELTL